MSLPTMTSLAAVVAGAVAVPIGIVFDPIVAAWLWCAFVFGMLVALTLVLRVMERRAKR